ncbi:MAG: hypothetical protein ACXWQO_01550 [Bdellovibrionota bacterium]
MLVTILSIVALGFSASARADSESACVERLKALNKYSLEIIKYACANAEPSAKDEAVVQTFGEAALGDIKVEEAAVVKKALQQRDQQSRDDTTDGE